MKTYQKYLLLLIGFYAILISTVALVAVFSAGFPFIPVVLEVTKILVFPCIMSAIAGVVAIGWKDTQ